MNLNAAQKLLILLGVDHVTVTLGHKKGRSYSYTKSGPGRIAAHGKAVSD